MGNTVVCHTMGNTRKLPSPSPGHGTKARRDDMVKAASAPILTHADELKREGQAAQRRRLGEGSLEGAGSGWPKPCSATGQAARDTCARQVKTGGGGGAPVRPRRRDERVHHHLKDLALAVVGDTVQRVHRIQTHADGQRGASSHRYQGARGLHERLVVVWMHDLQD